MKIWKSVATDPDFLLFIRNLQKNYLSLSMIVNKKAKFEYEFVDKYDAGIMLTGTDVKLIRAGNSH